jgi:DNA-binding response OmpR family regulator
MQAALDPAALPVSHPGAMSADSTHLKVLIAEDEPAMLSLLCRHMRALGLSVVEASDGDAAWQKAQLHHPDLVLLDVMMPGMSGWEVCKRIKGDSAFRSTGVIMLTGIGESLNEMTSPLFAADNWLNKPFDFADLDARVRETLAKHDRVLPPVGAEIEAAEASHHHAAPPPRAAKRAAAKKAAPKKAAPKKAAPKKAATPKKAAPKKAAKGSAPAASKKRAVGRKAGG